jgi:hypothetical protein
VTPILDGRSWVGTGSYFDTVFVVELFESRKHPGYYHYATFCAADDFSDESKKPMKADFVQQHLNLIMRPHGLVVGDLDWKQAPTAKLPLPHEALADESEW